jgi:hypothetical protein
MGYDSLRMTKLLIISMRGRLTLIVKLMSDYNLQALLSTMECECNIMEIQAFRVKF